MARHETRMEEKHEEEREHHREGGRAGMQSSHAGHREVSSGMEMDNMGPHPGDKRGGKAMHHRRANGGAAKEEDRGKDVKVNEYNAQGSPEVREAADEEASFRAGGKAKRERHRRGGHVGGEKAPHRMDRPARKAGGKAMGGGTPYSSGRNMAPPEDKRGSRGYESDGPA